MIKGNGVGQNLLNKDKSNKKLVSMNKGEIEFVNVIFWYRPEDVIFKDLSFKIESGKSIAIVGGESSGKKTILNLIQRFYDVKKGTIKISKYDVKEYDTYSLHKQIG